MVEILGHESNGVFQLAPERLFDPDAHRDFEARLAQLAISSGAPIVFGLFTAKLPQPSLELMDETAARGGDLYALTHCRGVVSAQSFLTRLGFDCLPEWQEVRRRPYPEQQALLRDPDVRRRLVHAAHHGDYGPTYGPEAGRPRFDTMSILESPYLPNPTVADEARRRGVDPVEAMIDIALEHDFDVFFVQQLMSQDRRRAPAADASPSHGDVLLRFGCSREPDLRLVDLHAPACVLGARAPGDEARGSDPDDDVSSRPTSGGSVTEGD